MAKGQENLFGYTEEEKKNDTVSLSIVGSSRANGKRSKGDFYPTSRYAVEELLAREKFEGEIWECACGKGDISEVLIEYGYNVYSSDLFDRGYGDKHIDFLKTHRKTENIITNPPFKYALDFVKHSKRLANKKIALLLKTVFLEGQSRYGMFQDKEFPLKTLYQFSKRIDMVKNGEGTGGKGMLAFAWFVWDREYTGEPIIKWIK